jgi:hypothetical protein
MNTDYAIATTEMLDRQKEMITPKSGLFLSFGYADELLLKI